MKDIQFLSDKQVDPAEPLVKAIQQYVRPLTARSAPRLIYRYLELNQVLLLLDGYDELPSDRQPQVLSWLDAFIKQYGENFIVMTGTPQGYGALMSLGISPLFLKPWTHIEIKTCVHQWANIWTSTTDRSRRNKQAIETRQIEKTLADTYALSPAELTFKIWSSFTSDRPRKTIADWVKFYIQDHLPRETTYDDVGELLQLAALFELEHTNISPIALAQIQLLNSQTTTKESLLDLVRNLPTNSENQDKQLSESIKHIHYLFSQGLFIRHGDQGYRFRHRLLTEYLASFVIPSLSMQVHANLLTQPQWQMPMAFAASHMDMNKLFDLKVAAESDMLLTDLLVTTHWLRHLDKKESVQWRDKLLKQLKDLLLQTDQFQVLQERIISALVESRDISGGVSIFEEILSSQNTSLQCLGALGIGLYWL